MKIKDMLNELYESGFSDYQIAEAVSVGSQKVPASIINRLRTGVHKNTSYERGQLIKQFYESIFANN